MVAPRKPTPINELPIFQGLKAEQVQELIRGGIVVSTKHHEPLFRAGDPASYFLLVLQGAYKLVRSDQQGHESIMCFVSLGDTIAGLVMSRPNAIYPVTCISIGQSMALKIPRETYNQEWLSHPALQQHMNAILYQRMNRMQDERLHQRAPLQTRVAFLLLNLIEKYSSGADRVLPLPITRQEIADSVGSAVESVIRLMSDWTSAGIIRTEDRRIEILQLDELIRLTNDE